jgi:hypothetical protein
METGKSYLFTYTTSKVWDDVEDRWAEHGHGVRLATIEITPAYGDWDQGRREVEIVCTATVVNLDSALPEIWEENVPDYGGQISDKYEQRWPADAAVADMLAQMMHNIGWPMPEWYGSGFLTA